jgi:ketosteroid isomerase-like protein
VCSHDKTALGGHRDLVISRRCILSRYATPIRVFFIFVLTFPVPNFAQPAPEATQPSIQLPPELARVLTDYEKAWSARDGAALARLFAEDGFVLPNSRPMVRGRTNVEQYYTGLGGPLSLRAVAYATSGTVGYIIGAFSNRAGSPDLGKFTLTMRKNDAGQWLIVSDMDNANRPPSGH